MSAVGVNPGFTEFYGFFCAGAAFYQITDLKQKSHSNGAALMSS
jgi:hypothetical protein